MSEQSQRLTPDRHTCVRCAVPVYEKTSGALHCWVSAQGEITCHDGQQPHQVPVFAYGALARG